MEKEKKQKDTKITTGVIVKKNKRTGKYYEKEVEVRGSGSRINLQKSYSDNWDEGLYSVAGPTISINWGGDGRAVVNPKPKYLEAKTLQEYLDNKYPTRKDKEEVSYISTSRINEERQSQGITELLEGGELDLKSYNNLGDITIDAEELKGPLTNIRLGNVDNLEWIGLLGHHFSFEQSKLLWDKQFIHFSKNIYPVSPLIKVNDLTQLAYQLKEDNWQNPDFIRQFGVSETDIEELKNEKDKVYTILDNLSNQMFARCVVVSNRLTHGVNKEEESEIIELSLGFQNCSDIEEFLKEKDENKVKELVDKALMGDKELLSRLQNLPWENLNIEAKIEQLKLN